MYHVHLNYLFDAFVLNALKEGESNIHAALKRNHPMITSNKVRQIRGKKYLATYTDSLGNVVTLCNDGIVRQYSPKEFKKTFNEH